MWWCVVMAISWYATLGLLHSMISLLLSEILHLTWVVLFLFFFGFFFLFFFLFFFFKQKTAYEIGTGDWSSDVCSSDLARVSNESRLMNKRVHRCEMQILSTPFVRLTEEIREIRIRPRLRHCKCWPCDALRRPRSPVWLNVLVSPGVASAYTNLSQGARFHQSPAQRLSV